MIKSENATTTVMSAKPGVKHLNNFKKMPFKLHLSTLSNLVIDVGLTEELSAGGWSWNGSQPYSKALRRAIHPTGTAESGFKPFTAPIFRFATRSIYLGIRGNGDVGNVGLQPDLKKERCAGLDHSRPRFEISVFHPVQVAAKPALIVTLAQQSVSDF